MKTVDFSRKLTKRSFQVIRSTFWPISIFERQSSQNRETGLKLSSKRKNSALSENCTKRSFQVMRRTLPPNRILERQSFQNCHAGLKFCWKRENSALSMKSVQNALFRSCGAILANLHFWASKISKSWNYPQILFKTWKQWTFQENWQNALFRSCAARFGQNRICERQSSQNRHSNLKFSLKRENSALSIKIVQNAHFRLCAARFGQIAFWSVKVLKIMKLASNSL